ncbi:hypothetical protein C1Y63_10610 [Corynebacterium sp. 13CS0277]|uniref:hypothetical protein n=1 Tax=Corynebacterium sp. 13CS0277 TaxID=2071994 RepID=UPI000D039B18|nr:hypothetical protein [Corynebacterium sp. 13CS0277]PRQ10637.1 hypothetical protein C1Y63_10610 [Corynebacterium sp. 13CS0277]
MFELNYQGIDGSVWKLFDRDSPAIVPEGTMEGLVGQIQERAIVPVGAPGQLLQGVTIEAMRGGFDVLLRVDSWEPGVLGTLVSRFRRAWSTTQYGVLQIVGGRLGSVQARVRLETPIAAYVTDPDNVADTTVHVGLVADGGVWWSDTLRAGGTARVSNPGDTAVWPRVRWEGSGQSVILPSGAVVRLPSTSTPATLVLDNAQSCVVVDDAGRVLTSLWRELGGRVLPEGVPPGQMREYRLSKGAELQWQLGVLDPWA